MANRVRDIGRSEQLSQKKLPRSLLISLHRQKKKESSLISIVSKPILDVLLLFLYSRLTLVIAYWEASHISTNNEFSYLFSLYLVLHTLRYPPFVKQCHSFSLKNLFPSGLILFYFIGVMVYKITYSISQSFLLKQFGKPFNIDRYISKMMYKIKSKKGKYFCLQCTEF